MINTDDLIDAHSVFERIEDLVAANDRLQADLERVTTELKVLTDVSTFMQSSAYYDKRRYQSMITDTVWSQWSKQLKFAKSTLAELKGQDGD